MVPSYVVTGGGRGVGRAITERLSSEGTVVVIELDPDAVGWTESVDRVHAVVGSAADVDVARAAARLAEEQGQLTGWVNNAAVFRDADLPDDPAHSARPGPDEPRTSRGGLLRRGLGVRGGGTTGVDRERLVAPGTASRARCSPLRHRQGRHRRTDPRGRRRPRAAGRALQRCRAGLDHHRALRGLPGGRPGPRCGGRGAGRPAAPRRSRRGAAARSRTSSRSCSPRAAGFVNGAVLPVDGGRAAYGPDPEER